jgi:DNA-binding response OmpR family regulator
MDTREVRAVLREIQEVHHDFLQLFMDAERRAMASEDRVAGRDPDRSVLISNLRVLVVDSDPRLAEALTASAMPGYMFEQALSGGQALDLTGSHPYHYVMVSENLYDLPSSMVARSVKAQSPDAVVLAYSGPGPGGRVEVVETTQNRPVINDFTSPKQLIDRLDELAEAFRAKVRERRYTQAFRDKYYDFLRRYVNIRNKVERALGVS